MAKMLAKTDSSWNIERALPWILLIGGIIALFASIGLSNEVFQRLKNPHYIPVCNLNPILSCTSVADSHQAEAFGFPNYFIGIAGYAVIATIGAAMIAGGRFKKWFWRLVQVGALFSFAFITWLQFQTLYRIGALCLFCMIVWAVTGPIVWYVSLYNIKQGHIKVAKKLERVSGFIMRHHVDVLVVWYLVIILLILKRFWYYWSGL